MSSGYLVIRGPLPVPGDSLQDFCLNVKRDGRARRTDSPRLGANRLKVRPPRPSPIYGTVA